MNYLFSGKEAKTINKFGVDITLFGADVEGANLVYEETQEGHFEEFSSDVSTYMWFIIEGNGTFVIDDEKVVVTAKDLVVVPPKKRIHYFGRMKMILCTTPAFNEKYERHIRDVEASESPYIK